MTTRSIHRRATLVEIGVALVLAGIFLAITHPVAGFLLVFVATLAGLGAGVGWLADWLCWHVSYGKLIAGFASAGVVLAAAVAASSQVDWARLAQSMPLTVATPTRTMVEIAAGIVAAIVAAILAQYLPGRFWRITARIGVAVAVLATAASVIGAASPTPPPAAAATHGAVDLRAADARALETLMASYDRQSGLWMVAAGEPGWWQSAVDLDAVIRAERALGTHVYDAEIRHTYAANQQFKSDTHDYQGEYYDDAGWWGLTWLDAADYLHDGRMLATAEAVDAYLARGWTATCGGGVRWGVPASLAQKNSITTELYVTLSARLTVETGRPLYAARALSGWQWLRRTGLVPTNGLVADHLDAACRPLGVRWSYTQGEAIAAAQSLSLATSQPGYVATARRIADLAVTSRRLSPGGILREPCAPRKCGADGGQFAGPFVAALGDLGGHGAYLTRNAVSAYRHDRASGDRYGLVWAGPMTMPTAGTQATAVDLLTAALDGGRA